jgi:hypothetical protein
VDGLGRQRHAQLGACSSGEMVSAIECAERAGWEHFVILAHNFELLKVGSAEPDPVVVARFERLCRYLGRRAKDLPTTGFRQLEGKSSPVDVPLPRVPLRSTLQRYSEQLVRRLC